MQVLVTGVAGFIGFHIANTLLKDAVEVVGVDNLNSYYDVALKNARLDILTARNDFSFIKGDISDRELFTAIRAHYPDITHIIHLAAQAGVRQSSIRKEDYINSNLSGQMQVLDYASHLPKIQHMVYASSSSVYGAQTPLPFHEDAPADSPLSFYGVTKRSGELMAAQYAARYGLPITGLRLFTSYGAYGRPDMAYYRFTEALYANAEIALFDAGNLRRDFTYIDDTVQGILAALTTPPERGHDVVNLGHGHAHTVMDMLTVLEDLTGRKAIIRQSEREAVEALATHADISRARERFGFSPQTELKEGLARFVTWFCDYHGVS